MERIHIRHAKTCDAAALAVLLRQVGRVHAEGRPDIYCNPLTKHDEKSALALIERKDCGVLVAEADGTIVGELIYKILSRDDNGFFRARKSMYIDDLCVDENYRGYGAAQALNATAECIAEEKNCDAVELNCWAFNEKAIDFYTKAGYRPQKTQYEKILKSTTEDMET